MALAYKNIEYEYRAIHLLKDGGKQYSEEYSKLNPMQQIPSLVVGDVILSQSLPILEYLEEVYPEKPILPKDPVQRAKVRAIAELIASGIQPLQNLKVLNHVGKIADKAAWSKFWIREGFKALEKVLEETSGTYCVGNEITLADFCLLPQVYNSRRANVDLSEFPLISRINETLLEVPELKPAHPSNQPDAEPELVRSQ